MWTTINYPEDGIDTQQDLEACWKDIKFTKWGKYHSRRKAAFMATLSDTHLSELLTVLTNVCLFQNFNLDIYFHRQTSFKLQHAKKWNAHVAKTIQKQLTWGSPSCAENVGCMLSSPVSMTVGSPSLSTSPSSSILIPSTVCCKVINKR